MGLLSKACITASFVLLCGAVALAQGASAPPPSPTLQALLDATHGNVTVKQLDAYIAKYPKDGDGYAARCTLKLQQLENQGADDPSPALTDCQKGVDLSPKSAFAHGRLADALYDTGAFTQSLAEYTTMMRLGDTSSAVYWKRCDAFRRVGRMDEALTDCNRAVSIDPKDYAALYTRGRLRVAMSNYADAITDLSAALVGRHDDADALFWRGTAYARVAKFKQAESDFTTGITGGDQSPDTYFMRGRVRLELGEVSGAIDDLTYAAAGYRQAHEDDQATQALNMIAEAKPPRLPTIQPPSQPFVANGVTFSPVEVGTLLNGLPKALDPNDTSIHMLIHVADPAKIRPSGAKWQYQHAKKDAEGSYTVDVLVAANENPASREYGIASATYLGLMDSGYAGAKWKALYDALTPTQRRVVAERLATIYVQAAQGR